MFSYCIIVLREMGLMEEYYVILEKLEELIKDRFKKDKK
jgi:hypothetical protein